MGIFNSLMIYINELVDEWTNQDTFKIFGLLPSGKKDLMKLTLAQCQYVILAVGQLTLFFKNGS